MKTFLFLVAFNLFSVTILHAMGDTLYPEVGRPCPEFHLKNVNYFKKKEVTLADFKGKWLVLDFWNKYCSSCIASFPKVNAMQKIFGDRVQFMLIGLQDADDKIRPMYEHFKKKLDLTLPCAFDSTLSDYWGIFNTPHIIVIDDKGIVRARTFKVDSDDIQSFLNGQTPVLSVIPYVTQQKEAGAPDIGDARIPLDVYKPYMINGNGSRSDTDFLFRSVLTNWNQANQYSDAIWVEGQPNYRKGMFQAIGVSLDLLYDEAYFGRMGWEITDTLFYGKYSLDPILEISDSSSFQSNVNGKNMFCYSLILSAEKGTKANLQKAMQRDLETYFGFNASIETRELPCWRLVASNGAVTKLGTKGGKQKIEENIPHVSYKFSNVTIERLIQYFLVFTNEVILDETGITQSVDFTSEDCTDFESLKRFLPKYGLKLIPSKKEMKVLVIRDSSRLGNKFSSN